MSKNPHIYKIGLFGYPTSGKTCIIASLGIPSRIAHPEGIELSWNKEPFDELADSGSDKHSVEFKEAVSWIEEAIEKIKNNQVPEASPLEKKRRLQFTLTHSGSNRHCLIELVDYSGELVVPDSQHDEYRKKIKQYFHSLDGILILAETLGNTGGEIAKRNTNNITNAFLELAKDKWAGKMYACPIGILVNKWDRYSDIDYKDPQKEIDKLKKALSSSTDLRFNSHLRLWNAVKAVAPKLGNSNDTSTASFIYPVSAFGKSKLVTVMMEKTL